jgi:hypothetical protein
VIFLADTNNPGPTDHVCPAADSRTARKWHRVAPETCIGTIDMDSRRRRANC